MPIHIIDTGTQSISGSLSLSASSTTTKSLVLKPMVGSSVSTIEVQNSSGSSVFNIGSNGNLAANDIGNYSGQIHSTSGSVTAPAFSFNTNLNTGIYSPSINTLGIVANGISTVLVLSTGANISGTLSASVIAASSSNVKINIINSNNSRIFTDEDNNKVIHIDTTTSSLCAIFPNTLSPGFNVAVMNIGTNSLVLSATQLNSAGTVITTKFGGAFVYKDSTSLFAVGKLI